LNEGNFASTIQENPNILVEFYAPWCGHCKQLAPEWESAATQLKGKAVVAKIDCTIEQDICKNEGVSGYPTIKFFKNGAPLAYNGDRTASGITSWVLRKTGDAFTTATSAEDFSELVLQQGTAIVGFFKGKDSALFQKFGALSQDYDDATFIGVFDPAVSQDYAANTVKVYTDTDQTFTYDGSVDLEEFVADYGFPLVDKLGQKGFERFVKTHKKYFVLLFAPQVDPQDTVKILEGVAVNYRKDLGFLWDMGEQYAQHASKLGFSGQKFPALVAMNDKEKFFPMSESVEFTAANIKAFLDDLLEGKIEQHFQSQPIPESNDGPVTVVVGRNYDVVVQNSPNDVFLEIYAPWCGHCKSLAPTWDQLGEKFKGKGVTIAKVDATANDVPLQIQGFPTLMFFKAGHKDQPIPYEGARDFASLAAFVEEQLSGGLKDEL